jgi:glycosyltransferase involved in cell wall biosynthesis
VEGGDVIVGLFPDLLPDGGVQRVGKHMAAALANYAHARGLAWQFLSLNDSPGRHEVRFVGCDVAFQGYGWHKGRFIGAVLRLAVERPAAVVAAHPYLAPVAWQVKLLWPCARMIVLTHGIEVWEKLPLHRLWALRRADRVLATSGDTEQKVVAVQNVARGKTCRLPLAVDPEFTNGAGVDRTWSPPAGAFAGRVVLTVGRLAANERYKGVDSLIQALPRLLESVPEARLVIVGEGDDRPRIEQFARDRGVRERVHVLGRLSQGALIACYRACDVFALPSRGEGFGLVFLEAMAQGKPVVGGAHGGTPDVIQEGATGFLVHHGDIGRLSWALERLLTDDELRRNMGERAKQRVLSEFSFDQFQKRLTKILDSTCGC